MNLYTIRWLTAAVILLSPLFAATAAVFADPPPSGNRDDQLTDSESLQQFLTEREKILQQHLTLYELERDLKKIEQQEIELNQQLQQIRRQISEQEQVVREKRENMKQVLRTFYMGQLNEMITFLFSAANFQQFLDRVYFVKIILEHQSSRIEAYQQSVRDLETIKQAWTEQRQALLQIKKKYQERLTVIAAEQSQLDDALSAIASIPEELEQIERESQQLIRDWEENVLPSFHQFFRDLSSAIISMPQEMEDLPLKTKSFFHYIFTLTDEQLNAYIHEQNQMLEQTNFIFQPEQMIVLGEYRAQTFQVTGHYSMTGEGTLMFHIDTLQYQNWQLPETTITGMEEEYDLGFYPQKLITGLKITDFQLKEGELYIELKLEF